VLGERVAAGIERPEQQALESRYLNYLLALGTLACRGVVQATEDLGALALDICLTECRASRSIFGSGRA